MFNKFILVLLFLHCCIFVSSQTIEIPKAFISQSTEGLLYNIEFHFKDESISGLAIFKNEKAGYHVMILSKFGPGIMDFILKDDGVQWIQKMPGKEKNALHRAIAQDFRILLLQPLHSPKKIRKTKKNSFKIKNGIYLKIWVSPEHNQVICAESRGFINLFKSFVRYDYTGDNLIPDKILLWRRLMKVRIEMNLMEQ